MNRVLIALVACALTLGARASEQIPQVKTGPLSLKSLRDIPKNDFIPQVAFELHKGGSYLYTTAVDGRQGVVKSVTRTPYTETKTEVGAETHEAINYVESGVTVVFTRRGETTNYNLTESIIIAVDDATKVPVVEVHSYEGHFQGRETDFIVPVKIMKHFMGVTWFVTVQEKIKIKCYPLPT